MIPDFIWLCGLKIETVYDKELCKRNGRIGETNYREQKIVLDPTVSTKEILEQTYIHELIHWILYIMDREVLRNDEQFVDQFAHLLYQVYTMKNKSLSDAK